MEKVCGETGCGGTGIRGGAGDGGESCSPAIVA